MSKTAAVLGGGSWGTALATVLCRNHAEVRLWARQQSVVDGINTEHKNPRYQSDLLLPENLRATTDPVAALAGVSLVCVVIPSHALRSVMTELTHHIPPGVPIVGAAKGIENDSLMTMDEVLLDVLPRARYTDLAFLSGPSFARETIQRMATAVTIGARFHTVAEEVAAAFNTEWFRCYTTEDVTGVELGGALKNVVAIASGVADGMGLGHNSRAALITRGLSEITRLAIARGANPATMAGLAGMGDLVLTCTGGLSRNRHVGVELGRGRCLSEILSAMDEVAEGVKTARSAHMLAQREGVEMPITREVYHMLYDDKPAHQALRDLMGRPIKHERTGRAQ
jgi:glycerol-3-phosphate dehydrogenase (NAD(P)+)